MEVDEIITIKRMIDIKKIDNNQSLSVRKSDGFQDVLSILFYPFFIPAGITFWLMEKYTEYVLETPVDSHSTIIASAYWPVTLPMILCQIGFSALTGKIDINEIRNKIDQKKESILKKINDEKESKDKFFKIKEEYKNLPKDKVCIKCKKAQIDSFLIKYQTFDKKTKTNGAEYECKVCDIWELDL